jgi:hypothetical protein
LANLGWCLKPVLVVFVFYFCFVVFVFDEISPILGPKDVEVGEEQRF